MTTNGRKGCHHCWVLYVGSLLYFVVSNLAIKVEELDCSFENNFCAWTSVNFKRYQYDHALADSGPEKAQDKEFYIHLNYVKRVEGFTGTLTSQVIEQSTSDTCFRFWYHMYGSGMGTLSLYKGENKEKIWTKSGNQNNTWHCAAHLFKTAPKQISFEAVIGETEYSVIAIDNIEIFVNVPCDNKDCEDIGTTNTVSSPPTTTSPETKSTTDPTTQASTTTAATGIEEFLPYIAGIPAGVLVVSIITLCVCLQRKKRNKREEDELMELNKPQHRHMSRPYNEMPPSSVYDLPEEKEEVYDFLDEGKMMPDDSMDSNGDIHYNVLGPKQIKSDDYLHPISRDYETPIENYAKSNSNNHCIPSVSAIVDQNDYEKPVTQDDYEKPVDQDDYEKPMTRNF